MRQKTWVKAEFGGLSVYSTTTKAGQIVYYGRVWDGAKMRDAKLSVSRRKAIEVMRRILRDPAGYFAERDRRREQAAAPAPAPALKFDALVSSFLAHCEKQPNSTYSEYSGRLRSALLFFNERDARSISKDDVNAYILSRRAALRERIERIGDPDDRERAMEGIETTLLKYFVAIGTVYNWGIKNHLVAENPILAADRPKRLQHEIEVLYEDEEKRLLAECENPLRLLVELLIKSGMRRGEALALRWAQVTPEAILINKSKTRKSRSIPLNEELRAVLGRCVRHVKSDYVLCDREGRPLDVDAVNHAVESALERAGIRKSRGARFNLFRHTYGSRLAEEGVSFGLIAKLMGNSAAICERHYIRFSQKHATEAMALLDRRAARATVGRTMGRPNNAMAN